MFFSKKQETEINIAAQPNSLIHRCPVDLEKFGKKVKLNVGVSCQAAVYYNGRLLSMYEPGSYELNLKEATKSDAKVDVIAINKDMHFTIPFGVGGIPFKDREARIETLVGISGECSCRLIDGNKIYVAYGNAKDLVTVEDVKSDVSAKLREKLATELAAKLEDYTYSTVFGAVGELCKVVKKEYYTVLSEAGIELLECSMGQPNFPEDYISRREQAKRDRDARIYGTQPSAPSKSEDEKLLEDILGSRNNSGSGKVVCSFCNKENDPGKKYCDFCGRKLQ